MPSDRSSVAFITGTTRGLGKALAAQLVESGWRIVEINRPAVELSSVDAEAVTQLFASHDLGGSALFINNAASLKVRYIRDMTTEELTREASANILGQMILISSFYKRFPHGFVLNISSGAARFGIDGWSVYCASKAAIELFLLAAREEGLRSKSVDPGTLDTDMQVGIRASEFSKRQAFQELKSGGRLKSATQAANEILSGLAAEFTLAPSHKAFP